MTSIVQWFDTNFPMPKSSDDPFTDELVFGHHLFVRKEFILIIPRLTTQMKRNLINSVEDTQLYQLFDNSHSGTTASYLIHTLTKWSKS